MTSSLQFTLPYSPRNILIGYNVHDELEAYLRGRRSDLEYRGKPFSEITADDMSWADVYVGFRRPPVNGWGGVRWIHSVGAGVDAFLFRAGLPADVLVTRTNEPFGAQIAEYCLTRALMICQHVRELEAAQRARRWEARFIGKLAGSSVAVVGAGEIGSEIARCFRAMRCRVEGVSRDARANAAFDAVHGIGDLAGALARAHWVIVALPLTEDTYRLIDHRALSACRGAVLMNVGRGPVLDERALIEALDAGWLKGAALDVFETEPLPADSALWGDPRIMLTPHIAGLTTTQGAGEGFLDCLRDLEAGNLPRWTVDRARGY
ncbi:MAG: D-2-hydroxyacid dehydrogenase [Gemmatimonadaceae bacterium]